MASAAILSLFATLSPEERVETFQMLVPLLAGVAPSAGVAASGKKVTKSSAKVAAAAAPKEKVSRPASDWTQYVMAVRAETGLKMAEAMAEAKRRRDARDPSCPLPPVEEKKTKATAAPKKTKAAPAPAPAAEEEESVELQEAEIDGVDYLYAPDGAAWHKEADGSMGAWAGYLNTETGEFDTTRPAPEGFTVAESE